jgi:hypothetical protein
MESGDNEKDYWEQQADLPLLKRGRGWWIEVGVPGVFMVVAPIAVIVVLLIVLL